MDKDVTYKTIREEILDQKKCQFQMFTAAASITAAIIAYAGKSDESGIVYIAPMTLNALSQWLVIDKAISIQRKVGYLQIMEERPTQSQWSWESDLDKYRQSGYKSEVRESTRNHTFATMICLLLMALNLFCAALYFFGPVARPMAALLVPSGRSWIDITCIGILLVAFIGGWGKRDSLVYGINSTRAVHNKWIYLLPPPDSESPLDNDTREGEFCQNCNRFLKTKK